MNQIEMDHLKRVTDICANRGEAIGLLGETNIKLRARITELNNELKKFSHGAVTLAAEVARLTSGSKSMQADAVNNTATIKMLMAQLAEVNEENRGLRQMLHMEPK